MGVLCYVPIWRGRIGPVLDDPSHFLLLTLMSYLRRILNARVYDVARETPLELAAGLSRRLGHQLYLKREDLQPVFSFKLRGAYNRMVQLSAAERRRGVIAASAGNHAQGVALAAQRLDCTALIVMPLTTPGIKVAAVKGRGATVLLHGDTYDEAYAEARRLARVKRRTLIHPYDDPAVIAGQGTVGLEILRQAVIPPDVIFVAVGGGGLIAGVAACVKELSPKTRIVGVEPVDADAMTRSLRAGRRVTLDHVGLFADGVAVRTVGKETFRLARRYVDEMILVDTDAICAAIKDVFEETRSILEPAGALAIAGAKAWAAKRRSKGKQLVAIACGANMNFGRLRFVAEQAELGEQREAILGVTIPERPGTFRRFCAAIGPRNITEFNYRMADAEKAHVFVGLEIHDRAEVGTIVRSLGRRGFRAVDFSTNEVAQLHVRHLVGGHAALARHELLFRFEFPERPGALMKFLHAMRSDWNISLFHYRNHGADYGRVLVGIQVPPKELPAFRRFLATVGYPWVDETRNPASRLFLG